jgi:hypothetical protein
MTDPSVHAVTHEVMAIVVDMVGSTENWPNETHHQRMGPQMS